MNDINFYLPYHNVQFDANTTFFTSDLHFGHKNIIKYPFILRLFIFVFYKLIKIENIINRPLMNKVYSSRI